MAAENDCYDKLLRPIHDQLLKNWQYSITLHLDDYVQHVNRDGAQLNFPEAALILQNSVSFYGKRVDAVYKMIQELVDKVSSNKNSEDNGSEQNANEKTKGKKRKNPKTVESDDLEVLDFIVPDKRIDGCLEKFTFPGPQPTIDVGLVSTLRKKGSSISAYDSTGKYLGYKEEFRLFGFCYCDGTVNEEFNLNVKSEIDPLRDDVPNELDYNDDSMDRDDFDPIEPIEPSELRELEPSSLQNPPSANTLLSPPSLSVTNLSARVPKLKALKDEWEAIPTDCQIRSYRLGVENKYDVPVELRDSIEFKSFKMKRKKIDEEMNTVDDIRVMWLDRAIRIGSLDVIEVKLIAESSHREALFTTSVKAVCIVEESHDNVESDADDNDFENSVYDDHDQPPPFTRVDEILNNDAGTDYTEEAINAIQRLKEKRRADVSKETEVAKRVAEWHESIAPVLEASEAQSQFDVHEYGSRILHKFPDNDRDTWHRFSNILVNLNKNEICRHFLSTLMLANTYNLEIRNAAQGPLMKDCVELRLLTKVRHHEEMDEAMRAN